MSLLGPDDFDLDKKERKKKLAKDLSPELQRHIDKWIDKMDEPELVDRVTELLGSREKAIAAIRKRRMRHEKKDIR